MIAALVLTATLSQTCKLATEEYFAGQNKDSEIPVHACSLAFAEQKDAEAAWHLYRIYQQKGDQDTAEYWLTFAANYPEAAKILAKRFEARNKLQDAAILWMQGGRLEYGVRLCLDANTEIPAEVKAALEKAETGEALFLRGRLSLADKKQALHLFAEADKKGFAEAKHWKTWLEGKTPEQIDKMLLSAMAEDPAMAKVVAEKAIALELPAILKKVAAELPHLSEDLQNKGYTLLTIYPEFARMEAIRRQKQGDEQKARDLMHQAAFYGDPQAVFFECMKEEPNDLAGLREKARKLSAILFSDDKLPDSVRVSCATWLAYFFLNREAGIDTELACAMAKKAHFAGEDALRFADRLLALGSLDNGRLWLLRAEEKASPKLLYELARRYRSLTDHEKWHAVMTKAAEAGHVRANLELGRYDLNNGKEAEGLLRISASADASDAEALLLRARLSLNGKYQRNNEAIVDDLILALAAGEGDAGVELSKMAASGNMLPLDPRESARYAHLAAKAGSREGMRIFGIYAIKGFGMNPDRDLAKQWLSEAAKQGDQEARTICQEEGFTQMGKDFAL